MSRENAARREQAQPPAPGLTQAKWMHEKELAGLGDANAVEVAYGLCAQLARQIEKCPASTMEGLRVKAFAVLWCHSGDLELELNDHMTADLLSSLDRARSDPVSAVVGEGKNFASTRSLPERRRRPAPSLPWRYPQYHSRQFIV
jgi:hypothetical protein